MLTPGKKWRKRYLIINRNYLFIWEVEMTL